MVLRTGAGLTRAQLAREVGVSFAAVFNWEERNRVPRADAMAKLAEALGEPFHYLMTGADEPAKDFKPVGPKTIKSILKEAQKQVASVMGLRPERVRVTVEEIIGPVGGKVGRRDSTG
jgi:transcriptional regulator with XRE-family HTH domain